MRSGRIAVVGGGPTGCLTAILLARAGHEVLLFEQRDRASCARPAAGRSINLAVPRSTMRTMLDLGASEGLVEGAVPLRGRVMHARSGELAVHSYDDRPAAGPPSPLYPSEPPYSVERGTVGRYLLEAAEGQDGVDARFGHRLVEADLESGHLEFRTGEGSCATVEVQAVVGADGAFSTVRDIMAERPGQHVDVRSAGIAYREIRIEVERAHPSLASDHFHLWPRGGFLLVALPNPDRSFTFTMFAVDSGPLDLDVLSDPDATVDLFRREFPDLADLAALGKPDGRPVTGSDGSHPLVTVRCRPWHRGRAVLVGDAAHALLPFVGRGTAEGLADAVTLAGCLERTSPRRLSAAFESYASGRRPVTDALAGFAESLAPLLLTLLPEAGLSADLRGGPSPGPDAS